MMISIKEGSVEEIKKLNDVGIQGNTAFTVTRVACFRDENENPIQLIKLRNQWSSDFKWKGDWGVDSNKWTADLKAKLGYDTNDCQ